MELSFGMIFGSFVAGLITFLAPCTLPLVPPFLGAIAGVNQKDLGDPEALFLYRHRLLRNAILYVLGFSIIFIVFGLAFTWIGTVLAARIWIQRIGGGALILFGLLVLGVLRPSWFVTEHRIRVPGMLGSGSGWHAFLIGILFALGWSPCVGPLLGSILFLASRSATVLEGAFLLAVFALGLGLPFIITAALIGRAITSFSRLDRAAKVLNVISGIFLVGIGALLVVDRFGFTFGLMQRYLIDTFPRFEEFLLRFL